MMFRKLLSLEWKAFLRSKSFAGNVAIKVFMAIGAIYFTLVFLALGFFSFDMIKDSGLASDPLELISKYLIYYIVFDLVIRLFFQKIPVINIRPLLPLPVKRSTIVNFALGKTMVSFFNIMHAFFFVPFSIKLLVEGYDTLHVVFWHISMLAIIYSNNFLNLLLNNKDGLFAIFIGLILAFGGLQYFGIFDLTDYTGPVFHALYTTGYAFVVPLLIVVGLGIVTYKYFYKNLYLDAGLTSKHEEAKTEEYTWLNQFGTLGTFLKNDIKLIRRNKRSKTTVFISIVFLFYGMLFFTGALEMYDTPIWKMFAAIFVSGGFLFTFGQFVPSWDSAYYPLMMSQNIQYKEYIASKWWLIVIGTLVSAIISSFYLYFGWEVYILILIGAVYNIGVNSYLVLLGGAFIKTPIDLASSKQAFGDKKAFNLKVFLISMPKLVLPLILYGIGYYFYSPEAGYALVVLAGILGFAFRNKVFALIERIYKSEKYDTLAAYKQKN